MGLIADTFGFRVTAETKKSEVGDHFVGLGKKLGEASAELDKVAEKAAADGSDKEGLLDKAIKEAVDAAKATLNTLKTHLDNLGTVGGDNLKIGEAASNVSGEQGVASEDGELKKVLTAFKGIVDEAEKLGFAKPEVGNTTLNSGADNSTGAKILSTDGTYKPATTDAGKAAKILETVSGEEMLASIVKSDEVKALKAQATVKTTPLEFAMGGTGNYLGIDATPKAAAVAGGIALRSLVKAGKLAAPANNGQGGPAEVQGVGRDAVNKLLVALEDVIKKTVKKFLRKQE